MRVYGSGGGGGGGGGIFELLPLGEGHEVDGLFDELERQIVDLGGLRHADVFMAEQFHRRNAYRVLGGGMHIVHEGNAVEAATEAQALCLLFLKCTTTCTNTELSSYLSNQSRYLRRS